MSLCRTHATSKPKILGENLEIEINDKISGFLSLKVSSLLQRQSSLIYRLIAQWKNPRWSRVLFKLNVDVSWARLGQFRLRHLLAGGSFWLKYNNVASLEFNSDIHVMDQILFETKKPGKLKLQSLLDPTQHFILDLYYSYRTHNALGSNHQTLITLVTRKVFSQGANTHFREPVICIVNPTCGQFKVFTTFNWKKELLQVLLCVPGEIPGQ